MRAKRPWNKFHWEGTQTDIASLWLNRPSGPIQWKNAPVVGSSIFCHNLNICTIGFFRIQFFTRAQWLLQESNHLIQKKNYIYQKVPVCISQKLGPVLSQVFIQCLKALYVANIIGFQFQLSKVNGFSDKI